MDNDLREGQQVPSGLLMGIKFDFSTETDVEKISVMTIDAVNEVTDPKLGVPNPSFQCSTCGAKDVKNCEGHFGIIKFPFTILHPYFLTEVAQLLNKICPGCKSIRQGQWVKGADSGSRQLRSKGCKYCAVNSNDWYPTMKFKVSSKDLFRRTAIIVELNEKMPKKFQKKNFGVALPSDYWSFIPKDPQQEENCLNPNRRVLSHAQVRYLLNDVDPRFIKEFVSRIDSIFLNCLLVTPNWHRVKEITHAFYNGQKLSFDEHTRACRKLVDFKGIANELSSRVLDCLKSSKLCSEKSPSKESTPKMSGLRWIKEVVLGKRTDHAFRMIVVGDPKIRLSEIGIPCHIAEKLLISEHLNSWNWEKLTDGCNLRLLEKGEIYVRRKGSLVRVNRMNDFQTGDLIYRPLTDGDVILINRPPSIHQHSLIALYAKVLPLNSVVSINPLCCSPLRGDFDGDCLHGYIPQSVDSRVELTELVALNSQVINGQSGRNLLSLSQDSLSAAHLVMEDGVLLNRFQMQQLQMFCSHKLQTPAIIKAPLLDTHVWTGKQLFSMLLPPGFNYVFPLNGVHISDGELMSSSDGSSWLRDIDGNLFYNIVKHSQGRALDILHAAQEVLCEWLSMRGLSVSLSDFYLSSDPHSRKNMIDEVFCGLIEAEETCRFKQLLVDSSKNFLVGSGEENQNGVVVDVERLWYERQRSAALGQSSVCAFKQVFRDIQNLAYRYADKDNSLLAMVKAGSKGNLLKLVQQSLCLGLQHSSVPLSFGMPYQLTCAAWNKNKALGLFQSDTREYVESYIPYAVVENSFLEGLNPLQCFVHSVTSRDSSFSDNADLPGTLTRRLMFFMRDLYVAYDGTVRNAYGNQLVQFSYNFKPTSTPSDDINEDSDAYNGIGGEPVGSLAACAISEAAYSALDQPISLLEPSPLLNLKQVLECGLRKNSAGRTLSLYLSKKLEKRRHGFEYGALEVKNHLEKLLFSDIVSTVMIFFSPQDCSQTHFSPWVCHFHVCEEIVKRRKLKVHSIIDALYMKCNSARSVSKINLPDLQIISKDCCVVTEKENNCRFCITVRIVKSSKNSLLQLDTVQNLVVPFLLGTVIKGCHIEGLLEVKKVDILWNDHPHSRGLRSSSGELYLRVLVSRDCGTKNFWGVLMDACLQIMDMIDWERSHPDNIHDILLVYGIDAGWKYFLNSFKSAISDIGKTVLPEHLILVASCLSATGEFVSLNAKGMAWQKQLTSVSAPFMQAFFSSPAACFIKAGKRAVNDDLHGSLDALAWGKIPSIGSGGHFDILYSGKGHELAKPEDVYNLLGSQTSCNEQNVKIKVPITRNQMTNKPGAQLLHANGSDISLRGCKSLDKISRSVLRSFLSLNDIQNLSRRLKFILHKYPINHRLNEIDKTPLMMALYFHPRRDEKIGPGAKDIKVTYHSEYQNTRCFSLVRTDGTEEDFSYHKCVHGALEIIDPRRAKSYQSKWLHYNKGAEATGFGISR